jgi:hypothetical protein
VVFVQDQAVESQLVGVGELVYVFLIETPGSVGVPEAVGDGDPSGLVSLIEVRRQIGIGHEVPAE